MSSYIISLDQGTSGTTAAVVSVQTGSIVASVNVPFKCLYPKEGWVEQDPEDLWRTSKKALSQVLKKAKVSKDKILSLGITNQRETIVSWNPETGKTLGNAIVWQCRRTSDFCDRLKKNKKLSHEIQKKTGLVIDPYFSASKIKWLLENRFKKRTAPLAIGTVDSFLIYRLTREFKTDVSNASRTQLMNLKTLQWDKGLLHFFKVPHKILPEICNSNDHFGDIKTISVLKGVPVTGVLGDQQAALLGQGCVRAGQLKTTYGTGSFLLLNTGSEIFHSKNGVLSTVAWKWAGEQKATYALEGSAFICGSAVAWLRDGLKIIQKSSDVEKLAASIKDTQGVGFIPSFVGLGTPYWQPQVRGVLYGLNRDSGPAHIARAVLESLALQNVDVVQVMSQAFEKKLSCIRVDGGACENNLLMQMQSNFLAAKIERPKCIESTALGAAFAAGLGQGAWTLKQVASKNPIERTFKPKMSLKLRQAAHHKWSKAIKASIQI